MKSRFRLRAVFPYRQHGQAISVVIGRAANLRPDQLRMGERLGRLDLVLFDLGSHRELVGDPGGDGFGEHGSVLSGWDGFDGNDAIIAGHDPACAANAAKDQPVKQAHGEFHVADGEIVALNVVLDLWRALDSEAARHRIKWLWVKGHAGHVENERADALARRGVDAVKKTGKVVEAGEADS